MATTSNQKQKAANAGVLVALSLAMFVYVIDTTIMGVSQSDLVTDLGTSITGVQLALTVYTLTMAAFMTTGAKLGKIWGAKRAFKVGLVVYGIGTVTTALAPNLVVLPIGWSVLEGLGSALIVPAINTLVRANYDGDKRAAAYGTLGGVAAAGAAVGPIVGGWITSTFTWRVAFWIEAIIVVGVLLASNRIADAEREGETPKLDIWGVALSAAGLGLFVYGILQTGTLGWGSPVVWGLMIVGAAVTWWFVQRSRRQEREGGDPLLRFSIFRWPVISAGVPVTIAQNFAQNGILYVVPVFAQLVLGLDALKTGLAILPLSIGVMGMSMGTVKLGHKIYPRVIIQIGMLVVFAGGVLLAIAIPDADSGNDLIISMFVLGAGIGLIAAQLQNVMLGGVDPDETSEAAGLAGTAQNLGMSLGTAVAGSVLLVTLSAAFTTGVDDSTVLADEDKAGIEQILEDNTETMGTEFETLLADRPPEVAEETERIAKEASDAAFQVAILALGVIALLGFLFAFKLPKVKLGGDVIGEAVRGTAVIPKLQLEPGGELTKPGL
ncbi:MAG: MFS transporter [Acidimicrobiales bacterium]